MKSAISRLRQLAHRWLTEISPPLRRGETWIIAALLAVAFTMRVAFPSHISVEHFDEGVYASNLAAGSAYDYQYPARQLYAPALLPAVIEWSLAIASLVSPDAEWGAFVVNLLAGVLTVGLIWWVTRKWFGREAGLVAAGLAALSDFHILYSRTALTETLMGLGLLLAVYLIFKSLTENGLGWAIAAGVVTGLTWWTKYNGWLPLAIGVAGSIPWWCTAGRAKLSLTRYLLLMGTVVVSACVVWSPVWIGLSEQGGYAAIQANHQKYVVGLDGWLPALQRQLANQRALEGWPTLLSLTTILLVPTILILKDRQCFTWNIRQHGGLNATRKVIGAANDSLRSGGRKPKPDNPQPRPTNVTQSEAGRPAASSMWKSVWSNQPVMSGLVSACAVMVWILVIAATSGTFVALGITAAITITIMLLVRLLGRCSDSGHNLAGWLLAAWFCGLLLATPLYRPYPRLMLPLCMATWIAAAAGVTGYVKLRGVIVRGGEAQSKGRIGRPLMMGTAILLVLAGHTLSQQPQRFIVPGWEDRSGLRTVAEQIKGDVANFASVATGNSTDQVAIYVFGEPALFFHLHSQGLLVGPIADFEFTKAPRLPVPTFVAIGPHARQTAGFEKMWKEAEHAFQKVGSYEYQPSRLVQLNGDHPAIFDSTSNSDHERIDIYLQK